MYIENDNYAIEKKQREIRKAIKVSAIIVCGILAFVAVVAAVNKAVEDHTIWAHAILTQSGKLIYDTRRCEDKSTKEIQDKCLAWVEMQVKNGEATTALDKDYTIKRYRYQ